ncbi:MAG: T9SS type A sorting domain-containing protein, partial [Bacteroidota bacterium]|nr:T9SS type A sorting domain-containing protein [Bacteroidota bacterium]
VSTWAGIYETNLPETMSPAPALPEYAELTVNVYPNPVAASRTHRIVIAGTHANDVVVDLYSIIGARLARLHGGPLAPKQILTNDVSGLSPGLYYYRVHAGHAWKTVPVMIQR